MAEKKKAKAAKKTTARKKKPAKKAEVKKEEVLKKEVAPQVEVPAAVAPEVPKPAEKAAPKEKKERPEGPGYYGTGRRKEAVAKVWLYPGNGNITLNGQSYSEYLCGRKLLEYQVTRPLVVTNTLKNYDVHAQIYGGGVPGQAGAVCMGIARALLGVSPDFRVKLKREGLLRRDPRMKERKKYGLKRARRAFQYTKR
jgi:small subunit ribosomal protein S9